MLRTLRDCNQRFIFSANNEFGRITQEHENTDNVGRNVVREKLDYKIYNNAGRTQEYYDGKVQHTIRNRFTDVSNSNRDTLALAIVKFSNIKSKAEKIQRTQITSS